MNHTDTLYGTMPAALFNQFSGIRLLVCDVDGVFSDGRIYLSNQGEELKAFHTLDGYGIKAILKANIEVAVITGRHSQIVQNRMAALGIRHIIQGAENKMEAMNDLLKRSPHRKECIAAIGDDMPDLAMFEMASLKISVPEGHPYVKKQADYITRSPAGFGAVREVCDMLLQAQGKLEQIHGSST